MPVSGVRSSWLTLASSWDLALLSRSAWFRAACRLRISVEAYSGTMSSSTPCELAAMRSARQIGE